MRAQLTLSSLLALTLVGLAARPAQAESPCVTDSDCVKGWTCSVSQSSGDCAVPACPPGEKCEAPSDCGTPANFRSCQPEACRADSDCASGMVCYSHTESNCPPFTCAPGQECATPRCEPKTESLCVPRYVLPCTTASDCGAGFQCEPEGEACVCSGSGGVPSDGGTPPPAPEESCECTPSKELRCHAPSVSCTKDGDCASGWTCRAFSSPDACATNPAPNTDPGSGSGSASGSGSGSGSGNGSGGAQSSATPPPDCPPAAKQWLCAPPYYQLIEGVKGGDRDYSSSPVHASSENGTVAGSDDDSIPPTAQGNPSDTSSAGCSMAHGSRTGSTLAVFGVLGLLSALRRRRAR